MAFTGRLGIPDSRLGNIILGAAGGPNQVVSDSVTTSDSVAISGTFIRTVGDAVVSSDSINSGGGSSTFTGTGRLGTPDSQLGNIVLGAAQGSSPGIARTANDTIATTDSIAISGTFTRTANDSTSVSDSTYHSGGGAQNLTRFVSDTTATSDAPGRQQGLASVLGDTVAGTDSLAAARGAIRGASDTITTSDSIVGLRALTRALGDTVTTSDTLANPRARVTQTAVEALVLPTDQRVRATQSLVEVLVYPSLRTLSDSVSTGSDSIFWRFRPVRFLYLARNVGDQSTPRARTLTLARSVVVGPSRFRVLSSGAEVLYLPDPMLRVQNAGVEVLYTPDPAYVEPPIRRISEELDNQEDSFARAVPVGLGTSDWGSDWVFRQGLESALSVQNGKAIWDVALGRHAFTNNLPLTGRFPIDIEFGFENILATGWTGSANIDHDLIDAAGNKLAGIQVLINSSGGYAITLYTVNGSNETSHGTAQNVAFVSNGPIRLRWRLESGDARFKVWPASGTEPAEWYRIGPLYPSFAVTYDADGYSEYYSVPAVSGPAGLRLTFDKYYPTSAGNQWLIDYIRVSEGASPRDAVYHLVTELVHAGSLSEALAVTDAPNRRIARKRLASDSTNTIEYLYGPPSAEDIAAGINERALFYDRFERELPLGQIGVSTSGWPYGLTYASVSSLDYAIANGQLVWAKEANTFSSVTYSMPVISSDVVAHQFDYFIPLASDLSGNEGGGIYIDYVDFSSEAYIYAGAFKVGQRSYYGTQYTSINIDTNRPEWRGQWVRVKNVFSSRNDDATGTKIWLRDDPEPDVWDYLESSFAFTPSPGQPYLYLSASAESARVDNFQIYDPRPGTPGWLEEAIPTNDTLSFIHVRLPIAFSRSLSDSVPLHPLVSDSVMHYVIRAQAVEPSDVDTVLTSPAPQGGSTIVVSNPGSYNTTAPIHVFIGGEQYIVASFSGNTITLTTNLLRPYTAGTAVVIRPVPASFVVDGVDITAAIIWSETTLSSFVGSNVGECSIKVKDLDRTRSIRTGAEIIVKYRGIRLWGGFVKQVQRSYAFSYGAVSDPMPRFLTIRGTDYNTLLDKRVVFNQTYPEDIDLVTWPMGTPDSLAVNYMLQNNLDLTGDDIGFHVMTTTDIAPYEEFNPAGGSHTWNQAMANITDRTRALYYIDADRVFHYVDDSVASTLFGFEGVSDTPDGTTTIGYRDFEFDSDGTKLDNDHMVWGAGQGSGEAGEPVLAFHREQDAASQAAHGVWQQGEFRPDMYRQASVERRALTWLYGSPANRRGHKDDRVFIRCTVFKPYFRAGDVVRVVSTTYGLDDLIPVRAVEIRFLTPFDLEERLTISHEIDPPWNTYEWWSPDIGREVPEREEKKICVYGATEVWEPDGVVAYTTNPPSNPALRSRVVTYGRVRGGWPGLSTYFVWIDHAYDPWPNFKGYYPDPSYTSVGYGQDNPFLFHEIEHSWTGVQNYSWGNMWDHIGGDSARAERVGWKRFNFQSANPSDRLLVTMRVDWAILGYNSYHQYWMGGFEGGYRTPLGTDLSFSDQGRDDDWPEPFNVDGIRSVPELIDMTSDILNQEGVYGSAPDRTSVSGSSTFTKLVPESGSFYLNLRYSGVYPIEAEAPISASMRPGGGIVQLTGYVTILKVEKAKQGFISHREKPEDGTECEEVTIWGETTTALYLTNDPSNAVYRFQSAYAAGSSRVYVNGTLQQVGVDYAETDPAAGLITFTAPLAPSNAGTADPVTGTYQAAGPSSVDVSDLGFVLPTSAAVGSAFGPQASLWPAYTWHGAYYQHFHNGVDFLTGSGTPIYAAGAGTVKWESQAAGGTMIHVFHKPGVRTTYAHLESRAVADGSTVAAGDLIGYSGASGFVTGAHLHWGLVVNGVPEDPMGLV